MSKKIILHLCADIGSDSRYYQLDDEYEVIMIGEDMGVENYEPPENVHGIIANPPCTEFSTAQGFHITKDIVTGMSLVDHCLRIIEKADPEWWVLENPANGILKQCIGKPVVTYQPYQYGSGWTKRTGLWGDFTMPEPTHTWETCPKNDALYIRPGRGKPSLAFLHKSVIKYMPEYEWAKDRIKTDADLRSLCSDGFAREFYKANQ